MRGGDQHPMNGNAGLFAGQHFGPFADIAGNHTGIDDDDGNRRPVILQDKTAGFESIQDFVLFEREKLPESDKNKMTMSLRIDENINMGKVDDVKKALRRARALIINYSARKEYREQGRQR